MIVNRQLGHSGVAKNLVPAKVTQPRLGCPAVKLPRLPSKSVLQLSSL